MTNDASGARRRDEKRIEESKFVWQDTNRLDPDKRPFGGSAATASKMVDGAKLRVFGSLTHKTVEVPNPDPEIRPPCRRRADRRPPQISAILDPPVSRQPSASVGTL